VQDPEKKMPVDAGKGTERSISEGYHQNSPFQFPRSNGELLTAAISVTWQVSSKRVFESLDPRQSDKNLRLRAAEALAR
jgi:hypothetical protein